MTAFKYNYENRVWKSVLKNMYLLVLVNRHECHNTVNSSANI